MSNSCLAPIFLRLLPADVPGKLCVEALIVSINQSSDMRQWYTVTKELQLASLQLCEACRRAQSVHLRVDDDIPTTLLAEVGACHVHHEGSPSSRVPRLRVRGVTWELLSLDLLSNPDDIFAEGEEMRFVGAFDSNLEVRGWTGRLSTMTLKRSPCFNQPIVGVTWPASLQQLTFGYSFNQPIAGVTWPSSLLQLTFGGGFD